MQRTKFQCAARGCDGCLVCEPACTEIADDLISRRDLHQAIGHALLRQAYQDLSRVTLAQLLREAPSVKPEYPSYGERHPHADVIHAWAEGAKIQFKNNSLNDSHWQNTSTPTFVSYCDYRVVEKPKEVTSYVHVKPTEFGGVHSIDRTKSLANLKLTFNSDNVLIGADVVNDIS